MSPAPPIEGFGPEVHGIVQVVVAAHRMLEATLDAQRRHVVALAMDASEDGPPSGAQTQEAPQMEADAIRGLESSLSTEGRDLGVQMVQVAAAQAIALALHNATLAQQQIQILAQATTARVAARILDRTGAS